jgi:hypothetical protein
MSATPIRTLQHRVNDWVKTTLAGQVTDKKTRAARFLEEALEAAQAAGLDETDAVLVLKQVYSSPIGELHQELGGSLTTLCALATAGNVDLEWATLAEMARMETPEIREKVRRRQIEKVNPR